MWGSSLDEDSGCGPTSLTLVLYKQAQLARLGRGHCPNLPQEKEAPSLPPPGAQSGPKRHGYVSNSLLETHSVPAVRRSTWCRTLGIMGLPSRLQGKRVQVVIHTACVGDLDPPTQHPEKKKKKTELGWRLTMGVYIIWCAKSLQKDYKWEIFSGILLERERKHPWEIVTEGFLNESKA